RVRRDRANGTAADTRNGDPDRPGRARGSGAVVGGESGPAAGWLRRAAGHGRGAGRYAGDAVTALRCEPDRSAHVRAGACDSGGGGPAGVVAAGGEGVTDGSGEYVAV